MNPKWQRRAFFWVASAGQRGRRVRQTVRVLAPQDSTRLAAASVKSALASCKEKSQHRRKENFLVYSLSPGTIFLFQFLPLNVNRSVPT